MGDLTWNPPTDEQLQAAEEIGNAVIDAFKGDHDGRPHTLVAAVSRAGGAILFRSFGFPDNGAEPGTDVLSEEANDHFPLLAETLGATLSAMGIRIEPKDA